MARTASKNRPLASASNASLPLFGVRLGVTQSDLSQIYHRYARRGPEKVRGTISPQRELGTFLEADPVGELDYINMYAYVGVNPINATDPSGLASTLMCRAVMGVGQHCFVIVTNDDGTIRRQFSYGPATNDKLKPGKLVETAGTATSNTARDDLRTWRGEIEATHTVNLNEHGITDDAMVSGGDRTDSTLGTPANPGPTNYNFVVASKTLGQGNSNSGIANALEGAMAGSSRNPNIRPDGYAPGWSRPDVVGSSPPREGEVDIPPVYGDCNPIGWPCQHQRDGE